MARGIAPTHRAASRRPLGLRTPTPEPAPEKQSWWKRFQNWSKDRGSLLGPVATPLLAFVGGLLVAYLTIQGQKDQALADFQRDQRQQHYSEILQQATRLHNAGDASASALSAGLVASGIAAIGGTSGQPGPEPGAPGNTAASPSHFPGSQYGQLGQNPSPYGSALPYYHNGYYYSQPKDSSWQEAYTGLDQAISNAEIASDDGVIALARALRDKYRADFYESVMENIDVIVATYPDPKPDKAKLADALVGVPADRLPPTYDEVLLSKSTDELTAMYADAAKRNLGITDGES